MSSAIFKSFVSGSLSGFTSTVVFQPFDLVKTRIQTAHFNHPNKANDLHTSATTVRSGRPSMISIVVDIVRNEKVIGLWKGVTPSIVRTVPGVGLYFSIMHTMKSKFELTQPNASQSFLIGASSRTIASSILLPFTVIKARYESGFFNYRGVTDAFIAIYKIEGVRGLWSGMCATVLRDTPFSGLYLMFYNHAKKSYYERFHSNSSHLPQPTIHFLCGIWAGAMASTVTQPPDVIKTHMQLYPKKHKKLIATVKFIYKNGGGVTGFFRGLVPRTMRRTLMAATAWTVYEQLMKKSS